MSQAAEGTAGPRRLRDMARVIRSKNAGPCLLTFDLMFPGPDEFAFVRGRLDRLRGEVARRYRVSENDVRVIDYAPAQAVKVTIPREVVSGDIGDRDVYGAQQHAPFLDIEL